METPSFKEDHISQIPAIQLLQRLGYSYLTQEEALSLRGGKTTQILQVADKEINLLKAKAAKLREQKKGLTQQLLTGKKRLKL